jgi:hypothetical protein
MSRWNRTNFYDKSEVDGRLEPDFISNYYNKYFKINRPVQFYTISRDDIQRPDLISIRTLGDQKYWWIIAKYNQIDDVWNDLIPGDVIKIPNIQDIEEFFVVAKKGFNQQ